MQNQVGLYIHIPFCKSRCSYCSFFSTTNSLDLQEQYFNALKSEFSSYKEILEDKTIQTIYFGGGTPSLVKSHLIKNFFEYIISNFHVSQDFEATIECNPDSITQQKLLTYKQSGMNRISLGLQAFQDRILKLLDRAHTVDQFLSRYELIKKIGFKNINIDLIFGIPNQTFADWKETLKKVIEIKPTHISCYSLETDNNSPLAQKISQEILKLPSENLNRQMYYFAKQALRNTNYIQYEISNFSRPGFECKHNLMFWQGYDYIGIGAGAHSKFGSQHYQNIKNITKYIRNVENNNNTRGNIVKLSKNDEILEYIVVGLRLSRGLNLHAFEKKFNQSILTLYPNQIRNLAKENLVEVNYGNLKLTEKGMDLENKVLAEFI
jgi:oxygen-independent coproporphyrinogen III oxidase